MAFTPTQNVSAAQITAAFNTAISDLNSKNIYAGSLYASFPIGTIMFWAKSITGVPAILPTGWQECDGTNGTPNLLGSTDSTKRFVRGTTGTTGTTGGSPTHSHSPNVANNDYLTGGTGESPPTVSTSSHLPTSYDVVPIMRIS